MKRIPTVLLLCGALLLMTAGAAFAWHVDGHVYCDGGLPVSNLTVSVVSNDGAGFTGQAATDEFGYFLLNLPETPGCYTVTPLLPAGGTPITPPSGSFDFCTTDNDFLINSNFVVNTGNCGQGACWLTAGGAKFEPIDNLKSGTNGPDDTWGGNVNPGCSPIAGDGGSWNHVAHGLKLHFHGQAIQVVRCGNVDGIPPGSTSPVTPFNYIDFTGTGTLKGIQGNKVNYNTVYFFAHCEDRNEPGSAGQKVGAGKDRYFLNVYTNQADPVGSSVFVEDVDGNPATVDPVTITDGNMQLHISSCAPPASAASMTGALRIDPSKSAPASGAANGKVEFAAPSPSPAQFSSRLNFTLVKEANVSLVAFDVTGRQVRQFANGTMSPGQHSFDWTLRNDSGQRLNAGVYFVRLAVDGQIMSRPVIITQ